MLARYALILLIGLGLVVSPTWAQEDDEPGESRMGWGVFTGFLQGGIASNRAIPGRDAQAFNTFRPTLDDSVTIGATYYIQSTERTRFEARLAYSPNEMLFTPNGNIDTDLVYLDLAIVPRIGKGNLKVAFPFGIGWASGMASERYTPDCPDNDLDGVPDPCSPIPGRQLGIHLEDGDGGTYFIGWQVDYKLKSNWNLMLDVRARRFHRLLNVEEQNVKASELTIGFTRGF